MVYQFKQGHFHLKQCILHHCPKGTENPDSQQKKKKKKGQWNYRLGNLAVPFCVWILLVFWAATVGFRPISCDVLWRQKQFWIGHFSCEADIVKIAQRKRINLKGRIKSVEMFVFPLLYNHCLINMNDMLISAVSCIFQVGCHMWHKFLHLTLLVNWPITMTEVKQIPI